MLLHDDVAATAAVDLWVAYFLLQIGLVCWLACFSLCRVLIIAVGIAWPNHLALFHNVYLSVSLVVSLWPPSSSLYEASARTDTTG